MNSISITLREFAYLAAGCGAQTLWGVPNPFSDLAGGRLTDAMAQAAASLAKRKLILLGFDGEMQIPRNVLRLTGCCALPDRSLLFFPSDPAAQRLLLFEKSGLWTECTWDGGDSVILRETDPIRAIEHATENPVWTPLTPGMVTLLNHIHRTRCVISVGTEKTEASVAASEENGHCSFSVSPDRLREICTVWLCETAPSKEGTT